MEERTSSEMEQLTFAANYSLVTAKAILYKTISIVLTAMAIWSFLWLYWPD